MAVVTPLNNFLGPEGDTVTVDGQLLNTEYWIGRSRGNLARTPDVAVVISLNRFLAPVDDTVTPQLKTQVTQVTSHKSLPQNLKR